MHLIGSFRQGGGGIMFLDMVRYIRGKVFFYSLKIKVNNTGTLSFPYLFVITAPENVSY